jgi:ATP-binding cassette subfamily B (MDR/TAP) protein 1
MTMVLCYAASFTWGWLFSLILLASFPVLAIIGGIYASAMGDGTADIMKESAQSSGYAEQALSAIKVVHTYGQEELEEKNYKKYIDNMKKVGLKNKFYGAIGVGLMTSVILAYYGYAFYFGGYLLQIGAESGMGPYTGGLVFNIMLTVLMGTFMIGNATSHF